jgi:hypothetical protein
LASRLSNTSWCAADRTADVRVAVADDLVERAIVLRGELGVAERREESAAMATESPCGRRRE